VDLQHYRYYPENMFDSNGPILDNLKSFRESDHRKRFIQVFEVVEKALNEAKLGWINYSKNLCWDDICHVISPNGYAPFADCDHPGKIFANNWITVYDFLT
jgi:hypothetical protein